MDLYEFRHCQFHVDDTYIYEITRSKGDIPFTVLVENFSLVGHLQFFCDIFVSRDWDVGRSETLSDDVKFLFQLWEFFQLDKEYGPFTPFFLNHPPSNQPPKVYRRKIEEIVGSKLLSKLSVTN